MTVTPEDFPPEDREPIEDPLDEDLQILDDTDPLELDEIEIESAKEQQENYQQE